MQLRQHSGFHREINSKGRTTWRSHQKSAGVLSTQQSNGSTDSRGNPSEKTPGSGTQFICERVRKVTYSYSAEGRTSQGAG